MTDPTTRHLGHGISTVPLPLPFPALRWVNVYVMEGREGLTVVDCGVDDDLSGSLLASGLDDLGYSIDDITTLVGSHLHVDHVGMAATLVDRTSAEFVMHASAPGRLDRYDDAEGLTEAMRRIASRHGAPPDIVAAFGRPAPRPSWYPAAAHPSRTVEEGDRLMLAGDRYLEVFHTPGHEATHVVLKDSLTGIVFSGDHVLPRITPVVMFDETVPDPLGDFMGSLERCEALMPGLTLPAHGAPIERGGQRARQIRLHHERRLRDVIDALVAPSTGWGVMLEIFRPDLDLFDQRLALRETLAHLEHLRIRGRVASFVEDGTVWFRRA